MTPGPAILVDALPPADLPQEGWLDQPFTWLGRALDRAALSGMRLLLNALLALPDTHRPAVRASAEPYLTPELEAEPRRFFAFLDAPPAPAAMTSRRRRRLPGGEIVAREFTTRYEPYHRGAGWREYPENEIVTVEHWMHRPGPPRATVIALHGFTMGRPWIDAHALMASRWFDLGLDVALLTLPYHGPRCPGHARYSGELFASWDVGQLNEAVRQAVHDIHLVKHWLRRETGAPVGLFGLSLGGYLAALMAGLCDDPAFVIPLVPPVCLGALPSRLLASQGLAGAPPLSLDELRRAYRVHMPTTYPLAVEPQRVLIIGARGDCVVPPEHAHALWHHWGRPAVHWFSGSHSALFRRPLVARVTEHLAGLGLLEEDAVAA